MPLQIMLFIMGLILPKSDVPLKRRYAAEIPTKLATYAAIAFTGNLFIPPLFHYLGWTTTCT